MSTVFPNGIDDQNTIPLVYDDITEVTADTVNRLRSAIIAVESSLGINPQGSSSSIVARLNSVDSSISTLSTSVTNAVNSVNTSIANLNGELLTLGTPSSGFLTGVTTLQTSTKITEALNTINNLLYYMAPASPKSLDGLALDVVGSLTLYTGKISTKSGAAASYYGTFTAGSSSTKITKTQAFTLTTHNTNDSTTGFSDADQGILSVLVNGTTVSTFNLGTSFDDAYKTSNQGSTYDGDTGSDTAPLKTVDGYTQIYSVGIFNNFPLWQKGVVRVVLNALVAGYNSIQVVHTIGAATRYSQLFELFYDNNNTNPTFAATPSLTITGSPAHFNYLSGIKFLTTNESLTLNTTINNAFTNTYLQTPLNFSFTSGISASTGDLSDPTVQVSPSNDNSAPNISDQLIVLNRTFPIANQNQQTINEVATITYTNPYGTIVSAQSANQNLLVNTYNSPASTALNEKFVDEHYRLLPNISGSTNTPAAYPNDYVTVPGTITAQWDNTVALTNGNAQVYNASLVYPNINFLTGYLPAQNVGVNYSGFNGDQVYYRAFYSASNPRSSGTLTINGITLQDLTQASPNAKVELKLPGKTGWLDLSLPLNSGAFTGATGQGCLTGNSGSAFGWSTSLFSTADSGFMYILRITLRNSNRTITSITESFTNTF